MALKIRLRQQGRTNRPFYRIVVADIHSPRDGRHVETLGWYNPFGHTKEHEIAVREERILHWIAQGAQVSENVCHLLKRAAPAVLAAKTEKEELQRRTRCAKRRALRKATS